jgi:hypothetical protein
MSIRAILACLCGAIACALLAGSAAQAAVADPISPTDWNNPPSGGCAVLTLLQGGCSLPNNPSAIDGDVLTTLEEGAEVVPNPWMIPGLTGDIALCAGTWAIGCGVAAFGVGVLIGRWADAHWLHFSGSGLGKIPAGTTRAKLHPVGAVTTAPYQMPAGRQVQILDPVSGQYLTSFPAADYGCGSGFERVRTAFENYLAATPLAVKYADGTFGGSCAIGGKTSYEVRIPNTSMSAAMPIDQPLQPYASQPNDLASGWANPTTGAGITTTAPDFNSPNGPVPCILISDVLTCSASAPGQQFQFLHFSPDPTYQDPQTNLVRHFIDPSNWAQAPESDDGAEFDGTGGPKFTVPDCYGESLGTCESAVNAAIAATGATFHAGFIEDTTVPYDPLVADGAVVGTDPALERLPIHRRSRSTSTLQTEASTAKLRWGIHTRPNTQACSWPLKARCSARLTQARLRSPRTCMTALQHRLALHTTRCTPTQIVSNMRT